MNLQPRVIQFSQATVIVKITKDFNGKELPEIYVQAIDAYRYQREWTIGLRREAGSSEVYYWESHAYTHPHQRHQIKLSQKVAERVMERFIELCEKYPTLLFNEHNYGPAKIARHEGFVHFHNLLLAGFEPSVKML